MELVTTPLRHPPFLPISPPERGDAYVSRGLWMPWADYAVFVTCALWSSGHISRLYLVCPLPFRPEICRQKEWENEFLNSGLLCTRTIRRAKNFTFPLSVFPTIYFSQEDFEKSKQTKPNKIQSILIICGFHIWHVASVVWIKGPPEFLAQMSGSLHASLPWCHLPVGRWPRSRTFGLEWPEAGQANRLSCSTPPRNSKASQNSKLISVFSGCEKTYEGIFFKVAE